MTAIRKTVPAGLWGRTTKVFGKFWQGVINLPDRPYCAERRETLSDIPRFPPF